MFYSGATVLNNHIKSECRVNKSTEVDNWEKGLQLKYPELWKIVSAKRKTTKDLDL